MGKGKRFTKEEAERLLDRRVRLITEFSDIPKGTTGEIIAIDEIEPRGFEIIVGWDLPGSSPTTQDWFTKEEFEMCLIEE